MSLTVRQPGVLTTVQDLGRIATQDLGVPVGGAMDTEAHRIANLLVGNEPDAATLECTLGGVALQFDAPALVALTGRGVTASRDGVPLPAWHAVQLHAGALLALHTGGRTSIAIAGGLDVPIVLGSRATSLRAGFGGHLGRALRKDDVLRIGAPTHLGRRIAADLVARDRLIADWSAGISLRPAYSASPVVRIITGPEFALLTDEARRAFLATTWRIASDSDRMGFRLTGPTLELSVTREMTSAGVTAGTIQLPPGGAPIVLMADRQTTGGYPRLGDVIAVDLPLLAQLTPGDHVQFALVTLDDAHALYHSRDDAHARATTAVRTRFAGASDAAR